MTPREAIAAFLRMVGDPRSIYETPDEAADALLGRLKAEGLAVVPRLATSEMIRTSDLLLHIFVAGGPGSTFEIGPDTSAAAWSAMVEEWERTQS